MKIALVGSPNVGKSMIFYRLTGQYVTVSNYPGTTVEVSWGQFKRGEIVVDIIDTPGIYSLFPISEEERVTRRLLLFEKPDLILHIIDAKNIQRMLPITLQLIEAGFKVILVVNMMDEARRRGLKINFSALKKKLGIPVIPTVSITGEGIDKLKKLITELVVDINQAKCRKPLHCYYPGEIEILLKRIQFLLKGKYPITKRSIALFLLQNDEEILEWVKEVEDSMTVKQILKILKKRPVDERKFYSYKITIARQKKNELILRNIFDTSQAKVPYFQTFISQLCTRPLTGIPILFLVLYFGIYRFVGGIGAGVLVDFLEESIFQKWLNPLFTLWFKKLVPWESLQSLFVGEYGIFTLGVRYAVAIILPIVGTFFFVFSILEDSGYFPRLALLVDRIFKLIGLNGRAVIPMVLGLGCDTMATLTTRILESRRERIIATLLLALAIPCSAQLGVITGLLSKEPGGLVIWFLVVVGILFLVGFLADKLMPGIKSGFYIEVPVLRWPKLSNIIVKTRARICWYFIEILPLFVYSSVLIWICQITGVFQRLLDLLEPVMLQLGLPREAAVVFLFGFFRRDYGACGLFDLYQQGILKGDGLIVASIILTLFVPCIAQFAVMVKEYGLKVGLLISGFIFSFAFLVGHIIHLILTFF
ncbi:ferrous iron transport protein B [Anoxybacter fermentans]|uniref:Ferrous iron transport protein B n=1 Tax=Anoxybacter fermentans TaxID=1323375 RepID=A0A3Q9HQN0_9FIRM|nr:ferrous iron transport protein B [Anoxybacter fermentans]AZR73584.1 ferrous iron transport protein B [Anoxybacter fermentans]